jgi:hypothetical protein
MIRSRVNPALAVHVRECKLENGVVGWAYKFNGLIEIDPRQTEREYLLTLCHEWLHHAIPSANERTISKLEKSLGGILWRRGYRRKRLTAPRT